MRELKCFYSWQSDTPSSANRRAILTSLRTALAQLEKEFEISLTTRIDSDARGEIGSASIVDSLFSHIDACDVFIADITNISPIDRKQRRTPNPNVLIELGYAASRIGWKRIICILNTHFGPAEDMPFDIRHRRVLTYHLTPESPKRAIVSDLTSELRSAIRPIFVKHLNAYEEIATNDETMSISAWNLFLVCPDDSINAHHRIHLGITYAQQERGDHTVSIVFLRKWKRLFAITPIESDGTPAVLKTPHFDVDSQVYGVGALTLVVDIPSDKYEELKDCDKVVLNLSGDDDTQNWKSIWSGNPGGLLENVLSASEFARRNEPLELSDESILG